MKNKILPILIATVFVAANTLFAQNPNSDSTLNNQNQTAPDSSKQQTKSKTFIDPLDGAFDMSRFVLDLHGFVPIPGLITEPALGGFGGFLGAVFLTPRTQPARSHSPKFPTATMLAGMYTANNSWMGGAGHLSSINAINADYRLLAAYASINMDFYHTSKLTGEEHQMLVNLETIPLYGMIGFDFLDYFNGGAQYIFMHTTVSPKGGDMPYLDSLLSKEKWTNNVSRFSLFLNFDNRDNVFTPNSGLKVDTRFDWSDEIIGSDFDYTQVNASFYGYLPVFDGWVGGLRVEYEQAFNDPPFYMLPYIDARGIPSERYQGNVSLYAETEHRIRIYKRWSAIGFGGLGKAFDSYDTFGDSKLVYNYGVGFRYLIARLLNLHMGADFGFGPDSSWAFYIVFGSSWLR